MESQMKPTRREILICSAAFTFSAMAKAIGLQDPLPPEGVTLKFDILYKGDKVGEHDLKVTPEGDLVKLEHSRHIDVKVMFVTAFTERYRSTEWWTQSVILKKLEAKASHNGKDIAMTGRAVADGFIFTVDGKEQKAPVDAVTLDSYWVANAVKRSAIIDVANAKVLRASVKILPNGNSEVTTNDLNAKFSYQGDFMSKGELTQGGNSIVYQRISGP